MPGDGVTQARPLRAYAEVSLGRQRSPEHEDGPHMVPYLRAANVKDGVLDLEDVKEMNFTSAEQLIFGLRRGDVLVTEGSGSLRAVGASAVWLGELEGLTCFQNTLLRLRPRPMTDGRFLAWWCRYAFADGLFASIATGANIFHVSADRVRALPTSLLSLERQRAISDLLDAETSRIEALVDKKSQSIRLMTERLESAIFYAVTHGLHDEKLRSSGLGWVEEIPESWGTPTVSVNFSLELGKMLNIEAAQGPDAHPYLRNVNVQWDRLDLEDLAVMHFSDEERIRLALMPNDLLVCEGGEVGRAAVWPGEPLNCYFQKAIHRIRPRTGSGSRFLMYCLRAAAKRNVFAVEGNLSTIIHLTGEQLSVHRFPWPSAEEQMEIVRHLDDAATTTDAARRLVTRQIALLQERRRALITAAVTGELDIPGAA